MPHSSPLAGRPRKRPRLSLTPLIDVIFLLLLFFMLSSTFMRYGTLEIASTPTREGAGAASDSRLALATVRAGGVVAVNGETVAAPDLAPRLEALAEAGVDGVLVRATSGSSTQDLVTVLEILSDGPLPVRLGQGRDQAQSEGAL